MKSYLRKGIALALAAIVSLTPMCDTFKSISSVLVAIANENACLGDVNSDGVINAFDIAVLKRQLTYNKATDISTSDLNGDISVDADDVSILTQYVLGEIKFFPIRLQQDTDGDRICDFVEVHYTNTNPELSDSDKDDVSDYDELSILYSSPTTYSTKDNNISDGDEDFDSDGLTNAEEISHGTNPWYDDSDYDKLTDYDEIYTYKTNPLLGDSDFDDMTDYAELQLGLNPNEEFTYSGINDKNYVVQQEVRTDSAVLSVVNESNVYQCSVNITASGYANGGALSVEVSNHAISLNDTSVKGSPVLLSYSSNYVFESATVNFELNTDFLEAEGTAITDYVIFRIFEDSNLLLPVATEYDEANHRLFTQTAELGIYCIVDAPEWLQNKGFQVMNETTSYQLTENGSDLWGQSIGDVEVAFIVDCCSLLSGSNLDNTKASILSASEAIFECADSAKIAVYGYYDESVSAEYRSFPDSQDNVWAENYLSVEEMVDNLQALSESSRNFCDYGFGLAGSDTLFTGTCENKFAFVTMDATYELTNMYNYNLIDGNLFSIYANTIEMNEVNTSIIIPRENYYKYTDAIERLEMFADQVNGTIIKKSDLNYGYAIFGEIYFELADVSLADLMGYLGCNDLLNDDGTTLNTTIDTDKDGLPDYEEIENPSSPMPPIPDPGNVTIEDIPSMSDTAEVYDEVELMALANYLTMSSFLTLLTTPVLPFNCYWDQPDSDQDGIMDRKDDDPMMPCENVSNCIFYAKYESDWDSNAYYEQYVESYDERDVANHALNLAIITDDEANASAKYVCEHCDEQFRTPEDQDRELLTSAQYALVTALQTTYFDYMADGDEIGAESIYHVIDSVRLQAAGKYYEYQSNGRYCSPIQYQHDTSELSYVDITMWQYTEMDALNDALMNDTYDFIESGIFTLLGEIKEFWNDVFLIKDAKSWYESIYPENHDELPRNTISLVNDLLGLGPLSGSYGTAASIGLACYFYCQDVNESFDIYDSCDFPRYIYDIYIETKNSNQYDVYHSGYAFNSKYEDMLYQYSACETSSENGLNNPALHGKFKLSENNVTNLWLATEQQMDMVS